MKIVLTMLLALCGCATNAQSGLPTEKSTEKDTETQSAARTYDLQFHAQFNADSPYAIARIKLDQPRALLTKLDLRAPPKQYELLSASGKVSHSDGRLVWHPPKQGGELVYRVAINSRKGDAYDARHTKDWVLMRLDDLFPSAKTRAKRNTNSTAKLSITGPQGWSFESAHGKLTNETQTVNGRRKFKRPTGWLIGGKLGTRREVIAGRTVTVSAPVGSNMRRQDTLAFLNWSLPSLARVFPHLPNYLLIVGAPDGMWRGGLSGPGSLYMHVTRPLISENATSPVLHELAHLGGLHSAAKGGDWIVEGLAEYYGLLTLRRSGGISRTRFELSLASLERWVEQGDGELASPSKGANTAAAVLKIHADAQRLREAGHNIDELTTRLLNQKRISEAGYNKALDALLDE